MKTYITPDKVVEIKKQYSQSKRMSAIESATNVVVGLIVSFCIQLIIYPFLEIPVTISQNVFITLVFFVASFLRGYFLRRIFNNLKR